MWTLFPCVQSPSGLLWLKKTYVLKLFLFCFFNFNPRSSMRFQTFGPHYMGGSIVTLKESFWVNFVSCSGIHRLNSVNQMIGMKSTFFLIFVPSYWKKSLPTFFCFEQTAYVRLTVASTLVHSAPLISKEKKRLTCFG